MRFVCISDTHNQHEDLDLPKGDVLLHAGDISGRGSLSEIRSFLHWFASRDFPYKVFIAGNHDFFFEKYTLEEISTLIPEGVSYLQDSGTQIGDFRIWGTPVTPWFLDWAFNRQPGPDIRRHFDLIPESTDILLSHGPVYRILDRSSRGEYLGSRDLLAKTLEIRPRVQVFGHIHEAYGSWEEEGILFLNASVLDHRYVLRNTPLVFDLP